MKQRERERKLERFAVRKYRAYIELFNYLNAVVVAARANKNKKRIKYLAVHIKIYLVAD